MNRNQYPTIGDITMVEVVEITDKEVKVKLLEYSNIEGSILLSNLSKSRIKSLRKVVKIGKVFPASVYTIDSNNYIMLSKKDVTEDEILMCKTNYRTLKYIQDVVTTFVHRMKQNYQIEVESKDVYSAFIWNISSDPEFLIFALKSATHNFNKVYPCLGDIDDIWKKCFQEVLQFKFKSHEVILEAQLELTSYGPDGIDSIKSVLMDALTLATSEYPFEIKMIRCSNYSLTLKTIDQPSGLQFIESIIDNIKNNSAKMDVNFKILKMPDIIINKEFEAQDVE